MGQIGDKIKVLLREKKIPIKEFAKAIEISEPAVYVMFRNDNFKLKTIEKINKFLNTDMRLFAPIVNESPLETKDQQEINYTLNKLIGFKAEKIDKSFGERFGFDEIIETYNAIHKYVDEFPEFSSKAFDNMHMEIFFKVERLLREGLSEEEIEVIIAPEYNELAKSYSKFRKSLTGLKKAFEEIQKTLKVDSTKN